MLLRKIKKRLNARLKKTTLIVAHPDDEALWFSSILNKVKRIIICFGPSSNLRLTKQREEIEKRYPFTNITFLNIKQSDVFKCADWENPKLNLYGLELLKNQKNYIKNFHMLKKILLVELKHESSVVTHNPWGEYGHEEHIQIFNLLFDLKNKINYKLYVNSYVSKRSYKLMLARSYLLTNNSKQLITNIRLGKSLKKFYQRYECWTWGDEYEWPNNEIIYLIGNSPKKNSIKNFRSSNPLNFLIRYTNENKKETKKILTFLLGITKKLIN